MADFEIYEPHEKLVRIEVAGRPFEVPERNKLLRCLQYLSPENVGMGSFCWNAECRNCRANLRRGGLQREVLCCQVLVREGDGLEPATAEFRWALRNLLRGENGSTGPRDSG